MGNEYRHCFAIFFVGLSKLTEKSVFRLEEQTLLHRLYSVLRLRRGSEIILFNDELSCLVEILELERNYCSIKIKQITSVSLPTLRVHVYLGLLKKPSFEEALYFACEAGATALTPVIFDKIHANFWSDKELDRLKKIVISAREQSKNFLPFQLSAPIKFVDLVNNESFNEATNIVFDPTGVSALELVNQITNTEFSAKKGLVNLIIGPEGGFTDIEFATILASNVLVVSLTKTILRAPEAVLVGTSLFGLNSGKKTGL